MVVKRTALKRRMKALGRKGEVGDEPKDLRVVVEDQGGPAKASSLSLCVALTESGMGLMAAHS